jgi:phosphate starvation-inducible membrane PsiE
MIRRLGHVAGQKSVYLVSCLVKIIFANIFLLPPLISFSFALVLIFRGSNQYHTWLSGCLDIFVYFSLSGLISFFLTLQPKFYPVFN